VAYNGTTVVMVPLLLYATHYIYIYIYIYVYIYINAYKYIYKYTIKSRDKIVRYILISRSYVL